jgi:hypothetical protein
MEDKLEPKNNSHVTIKCFSLDSLSHPKKNNPIKVPSKKNANNPSIAKGAPKISPTKRLYEDQFIPNWNS